MRNARAGQDDMRKWETSVLALSPDAGKRFGSFTEANIGNQLAVVLDNQIVSVATIKAGSRIPAALPEHGQRSRRPSDLALVCAPARCRRA